MDLVSIYVPTTAAAVGGKRAVMITLHRCVQSADDFKNGNDWGSVVDQFGMVVAIPDAPGNVAADVRSDVIVGQGWGYYFTNHTRNNRFNDNILELADELLGRNALNIDPRRVFISGLSSGGGETMVMGCLAPDRFAGIGITLALQLAQVPNQISSVATNKNAGGRRLHPSGRRPKQRLRQPGHLRSPRRSRFHRISGLQYAQRLGVGGHLRRQQGLG